MLLETQTLNEQLSKGHWQILAVTQKETFEQVHIPGALWIDPTILFQGQLYPDPAVIEQHFVSQGVDAHKPCLVYDDGQGILAGRLFWTLSWLGHTSLTYLNGGMVKWLKEQRPCEQGLIPVTPLTSNWTHCPEFMINAEQLQDCLSTIQLWDARSLEEYEGYWQKAIQAGHIPGAIHYEWSKALRNDSALLRPLEAIREELVTQGFNLDQRTVVYCQTHRRSSFAFMVGQLLGFKHLQAYVGGWQEWGNNVQYPVETCLK